jgi:hypothetical protein
VGVVRALISKLEKSGETGDSFIQQSSHLQPYRNHGILVKL